MARQDDGALVGIVDQETHNILGPSDPRRDAGKRLIAAGVLATARNGRRLAPDPVQPVRGSAQTAVP